MATLLRIDASSQLEGSHSRELGDFFVQQWSQAHPAGRILVRDLVREPIGHITANTINGFHTPKREIDSTMRQATALSDRLIGELMQADLLLIDTPMYNFSIPSALKAWIDQIVRIGVTFNYSPENGFSGLIKNKQAFLVTASGAVFSNEPMQSMDFVTPYLTTLLAFLGIEDVKLLTLEGTTTDPLKLQLSKQTAKNCITKMWGEV
jgi:FMN-dependent NADH-azoreductase